MRKKRGGVIRRLKKHATRATARRDQTVCETFGLVILAIVSAAIVAFIIYSLTMDKITKNMPICLAEVAINLPTRMSSICARV